MRIKFSFLLFFTLFTAQVSAADLFENGRLRQINSGTLILPSDTIGGYPIFQDDGRWKFVSGRESTSSGGTSQVNMGDVLLDYFEGSYLLARQSLVVSLGYNSSSHWTGSPCSPNHLFIRNKGQGQQDNCMTIDPLLINLGAVPTLFLKVLLTNSGSSGRYYVLTLYINADLLGVRNSGPGDWTKEVLNVKPHMRKALTRLSTWAEQIQDGSIRAMEFSKPQDVYLKIPSIMTLLPIPEDLAASGVKFSANFLSALESSRNQPTFSAIAYSHINDYKTGWESVWGKDSQELADAQALAGCEARRISNKSAGKTCVVYKFSDEKIRSLQNTNLTPKNESGSAMTQKLEKLKELHSKGLISKDQYDKEVKELLNKL